MADDIAALQTALRKRECRGPRPSAGGAEGTLPGGQVIPRKFFFSFFAAEGGEL